MANDRPEAQEWSVARAQWKEQQRLKDDQAGAWAFKRIVLTSDMVAYEFYLCLRPGCGDVVWNMQQHRQGCP